MSTKRDLAFTWVKAALASLDLAGKKVAVVGGTDGLGRAIAHAAASRGAEVTVVGRTNREAPGTQRISFVQCDLSLMRNATALGAGPALGTDLDVLLFTNGIFSAPKRQVRERQKAVGRGGGPARQ